jgi:hypothetical protein
MNPGLRYSQVSVWVAVVVHDENAGLPETIPDVHHALLSACSLKT